MTDGPRGSLCGQCNHNGCWYAKRGSSVKSMRDEESLIPAARLHESGSGSESALSVLFSYSKRFDLI